VSTFETALQAVNDLRQSGTVTEYAVAGAMALVFWIEPVATYDLDVLVLLPESSGPIVSLEPIYRWAAERGFTTEREHVIIGGIPVQFLPSHNALADEAVHTAVETRYGSVNVRVVRPEYLSRSTSRHLHEP
jgi:hypothetical protein